jgi:hypothetical protein
VQYNALSTA